MKIANNLKKIRLGMELSQEALARKIGISLVTYCRIENGKELPSIETAFKIAIALNDQIEKIFYVK